MRFIPAAVVASALILSGPIIGQLRAALEAAFPGQYRNILVATVAVLAAACVAAALLRIRERRAVRYALIALALALAVSYGLASRTGDPSVDAVENFHFIEYGVVTLLFYRAWRPVGDASLFVLPVLAGVLVGTLEEWLQWFVPARVGEVRDVFLNLWAIGCGLLFSVALSPPDRVSRSLSRASRVRIRRLAALTLVVFGFFFESVHLGYEIADAAGGRFRSKYSAQQLAEVAGERAERWRTNPPLTWSRYSREDQFFSEGVALVRRRNQCWAGGDVACAWRSNVILERYYAPVIDTPSFVSSSGLRWPPAQRQDAERRAHSMGAEPPPLDHDGIYTWPKPAFRAAVAVAVAAILLL